MKRPIVGIIMAGTIVLAGCKPSAQRAIEEGRADAQLTVARAQKIGASLASIPPVTKEGLTIATPIVIVADHKPELPTATVIYAEDVPELSAPVEHSDRIPGASLMSECASLLMRGKHVSPSNTSVHANVVKSYLAKCKNLTHLFVIRTRKKEAREIVGDVVAFELATGKYQGGFPLDIQSEGRTDKVTNTRTTTTRSGVAGRRVKRTVTTSESSVNADAAQLRSDLDDAIDGAIQRLLPTAKFID